MSNSSAPVPASVPPSVSGKLSPEDLIALNDEIAAMAKAGLPLDQGLSALAVGMGRGRLRDVTESYSSSSFALAGIALLGGFAVLDLPDRRSVA